MGSLPRASLQHGQVSSRGQMLYAAYVGAAASAGALGLAIAVHDVAGDSLEVRHAFEAPRSCSIKGVAGLLGQLRRAALL